MPRVFAADKLIAVALRKKRKRQPTRSKALEERLWRATAREVLSPVTLGLAHDLNNQLTGILSLSDLCLQESEAASSLRKQLELIRSSGQRAAELVRTLFREHQAMVGRAELHDLNTLAKSYFELAQRGFPKFVEATLTLASEPLPVILDAVGFRTALLQLAFGMASGLGRGSTVSIRTVDENASRRGSKPVRSRVGCVIECTGSAAMNGNDGAELFDLQMVERFVIAGGGTLDIQRGVPRAITVTLWLPKADLD